MTYSHQYPLSKTTTVELFTTFMHKLLAILPYCFLGYVMYSGRVKFTTRCRDGDSLLAVSSLQRIQLCREMYGGGLRMTNTNPASAELQVRQVVRQASSPAHISIQECPYTAKDKLA
jgi:hypothetical protein